MMPPILDHIDLRVRRLDAAIRFYDAILTLLGAVRSDADAIDPFTTWRIPPPGGPIDAAPDNFGICEDRTHDHGSARIAFQATSRGAVDAVAALLPSIGARNVETDDGIYGPNFYAVFFEDPDGNKLEVCSRR